jgi:hypothetical protein
MLQHEPVTHGTPADAPGGKRKARPLTAEGLRRTQVLLSESVDAMTRAVADFERLSRLAVAVAQRAEKDAA